MTMTGHECFVERMACDAAQGSFVSFVFSVINVKFSNLILREKKIHSLEINNLCVLSRAIFGIVSHSHLGNVPWSRLDWTQTFNTLAFHISQRLIITITMLPSDATLFSRSSS